MRPRRVQLLCGWALLLVAAGAGAQTSEKMRAQIRAALPKYSPPAPDAKPADSTIGRPAPLSDDPVIHLPDYVVTEPRAPGGDADSWLTKKGVQEKALKEYKDSMNILEWALNCFSIPFLTPSVQARADAAHAEKKLAAEARQFATFVDTISAIDPEYARKLARDADPSRHPDH